MIKGISRQAVIVRPKEASGFEQAIFVLSEEEALLHSPEEMLSLAEELAGRYSALTVKKRTGKKGGLAGQWLFFLLGCGAVGTVWLLSAFLI